MKSGIRQFVELNRTGIGERRTVAVEVTPRASVAQSDSRLGVVVIGNAAGGNPGGQRALRRQASEREMGAGISVLQADGGDGSSADA